MDLSLSGLASGFDWKTLVDQLMSVQNAPINKLKTEKTTNTSKNTALADLDTKLTALRTSVTSLAAEGLFSTRKAVSTTTGSTWKPLASADTLVGSYQFAVSQLATAARRNGALDLGRHLNYPNTDNDVSGLTLATLPTASAVTAGTFSVNGQKVTVATTDSLDQVFTAISTATSGAVTAAYDYTTDKITLSSGSEIVLGAANDTSNFLATMRLANNGSGTIESSGKLGTVNPTAFLTSARLNAAITAVDGSGNGSFSLNGVAIAYNVNTDSLAAVVARINQSTAGVTAAFDATSDRMTLTNNTTGDIGIAVSETAGGLMDALGLTTGSTLVHGKNAEFTVNGGATLTSSSNTLDAAAHGITGLSLTVDTEATQTISVAGDTAGMRSAIEGFITKFNDVQSFIDTNTKITAANGKVTTALLSGNREIQGWASSLRSKAFATIAGLSGTISRLEHLGIDFKTGTSLLEIKDGTKLDTALRDKAGDVEEFFQTNGTGLMETMGDFIDAITEANGDQQERLTKSNTDIDTQIANIQRRLDQQRQLLTNSFIAMESAQSRLQTQSAALTKAFSNTSTTK